MAAFDVIHGGPPALPGSCIKCSSAKREVYIDLKFDIEFHGAVYLCGVCVGEMANHLDFASPEQYEKALKENESLKSSVKLSIDLIKSLEEINNGYRSLDNLTSADIISLFPDDNVSDEGLSETEDELGTGEEGSVESSDDDGLDFLRTTEPIAEPSKF